MFPKKENFIHARRVHTGIQKTIPAVSETRKMLFFKETELYTANRNIWNRSHISNEFLHNQLRPVLRIMCLLGVLPVKLPVEGKYKHYEQELLHFERIQINRYAKDLS